MFNQIIHRNNKKADIDKSTNPKTIQPIEYEYKLFIKYKDSTWSEYRNTSYRQLYKVYWWFLVKDSATYNIRYKNGQRILIRDQITCMRLDKVESSTSSK